MKIFQKGTDYFGYYCWIKAGNGGLSFRFDTGGLDLVFGISINWRDEKWIVIKLFNCEATYFFKPDWE